MQFTYGKFGIWPEGIAYFEVKMGRKYLTQMPFPFTSNGNIFAI